MKALIPSQPILKFRCINKACRLSAESTQVLRYFKPLKLYAVLFLLDIISIMWKVTIKIKKPDFHFPLKNNSGVKIITSVDF